MKELTLKKVRAASCFGLMTDEITDVSVTSQLITFVQYFCTQSETVETKYLSNLSFFFFSALNGLDLIQNLYFNGILPFWGCTEPIVWIH